MLRGRHGAAPTPAPTPRRPASPVARPHPSVARPGRPHREPRVMATVQPHRVRAGRGVELGLLAARARHRRRGVRARRHRHHRTRSRRTCIGYGARHGGARARHAPGAALARAVRGPGDPADHGGAQRHRPRDDLPDRPRVRRAGPRGRRSRSGSWCGRRSRWCSPPPCSSCCATTARCAGTRTPRWSPVSCSSLLPLIPGLGASINGARIWVRVGGRRLPARRVRQDRVRRLLRRLPGHPPRHPRARRAQGAGPAAAAPARPRADPHRLGRVGRRPRARARPRAPRCCSSACSSRCSTSPPSGSSWVVIGLLLFVGGAVVAASAFSHVGGAVRRLAATRSTPRSSTRARAAPGSWCAGCSAWPAAGCSAPAGGRGARTWCRSPSPTSSSRRSARSSGSPGCSRSCSATRSSPSAACAPRSACATASASCSRAASRSSSRCRRSSWSAASRGSSR